MMALEWRDVDLQKRQLCVQRSDWKGQVTILMQPLPYHDPNGLVVFFNPSPRGFGPSASPIQFNIWRDQTRAFQGRPWFGVAPSPKRTRVGRQAW